MAGATRGQGPYGAETDDDCENEAMDVGPCARWRPVVLVLVIAVAALAQTPPAAGRRRRGAAPRAGGEANLILPDLSR